MEKQIEFEKRLNGNLTVEIINLKKVLNRIEESSLSINQNQLKQVAHHFDLKFSFFFQ